MMTARIAGIGAYVPENLITNDDLAKIVDTNDEWIRTRTGIRERRISSGEGTRHLAAKAAERALAAAGVAPEELDIIILGTSSPDRNYPSDACSVQAAIGADPDPCHKKKAQKRLQNRDSRVVKDRPVCRHGKKTGEHPGRGTENKIVQDPDPGADLPGKKKQDQK